MKNETGYLLSFVLGGAIGAGVAWFLAKSKYEALADEQIASVKESFRLKYEGEDEEESEEAEPADNLPQASGTPSYMQGKSVEKPDITSYRNIIRDERYSPSPSEDVPDGVIEIIPPEDFGEDPDYIKIDLIMTANGYLLDEDMEPVEDEYSLLGMGVNDVRDHFGEYEDDSVYVVNHERKAYYVILDSIKEYKE